LVVSWGAERVGGVLATLWLALMLVADVLIHDAAISLSPLFALSPLIACAVLPAVPTVAFALAAVAAAAVSGLWNGSFESTQHLVRVLDVALVSAVAVVIAALRVRRERKLGRMTAIAEAAQRAVLPLLPAHARRVDTAVRYVSAARDAVIGGDLYDCYHSRTHTRFLVGDVRGKGIAAVEQAARVIRAFRQAAAIQPGLDTVAEDMSGYLMPFFDEEEFVTALLVDVTVPGTLTMVSAGHLPPLLIHPDATAEYAETAGALPLGLGDDYGSLDVSWQPGDRLLLYTDGLSEARDEQGEFLDPLTLVPLLVSEPLESALDRVLEAMKAHVAPQGLGDDVALMLLEYSTAQQEYRPIEGEHDWRASLAR
jgi:serine phosphatase RsbU (regulator of sigma subunit)